MDRLPRPAESFFDGTPPLVRAYIEQLHAILDRHETRIADLETRLNRNSKNSSKPPSSDGPNRKPAPPREPSGRKRGGQPGHVKHEQTILPPDESHDDKPTNCQHCDTALVGDDPHPAIDQVVELPVKLRHVIHYRRHTLLCPHCQTQTTAAPRPEAASGFGPQVQAFVSYLSGVGRMGKRGIRTLFADLFAIPLSLGTVSKLERKTSDALQPIHEDIHRDSLGRDANVDETGWKERLKKAWLWATVVAKRCTVFLIRPKRNRVAFDDLVGPNPGLLTSDRYGVYTHLRETKHQLCWAHLRRDFQSMVDRDEGGKTIGEDLLLHAKILFQHWQKVRDGTRTRAWFLRTQVHWLRDEVKAIFDRGQQSRCPTTARLCRELLPVEKRLWTFASHDGIEPTNNAAERAVRHAVCWRKTSFGTDSERGSRFVERMLTVVATCRQQGRDILDFLTQALAAHHNRGQRPSLIPVGV